MKFSNPLNKIFDFQFILTPVAVEAYIPYPNEVDYKLMMLYIFGFRIASWRVFYDTHG